MFGQVLARYAAGMDFNDQLQRYFGTADLATITPAALEGGIDRMAVDFGLETDRARRFALWTVMHVLGVAPELEIAFPDEADRDAARDFTGMIDRMEPNA